MELTYGWTNIIKAEQRSVYDNQVLKSLFYENANANNTWSQFWERRQWTNICGDMYTMDM